MPHQCTNCGHTFPDGSKEMLSGCPDCGGNKFQFAPSQSTRDAAKRETSDGQKSAVSGADTDNSTGAGRSRSWPRSGDATRERETDESSETFTEWPDMAKPPEERGSTENRRTGESGGSAKTTETAETTETTETTGSDPRNQGKASSPPSRNESPRASNAEDSAQANARTEVVSSDELPSSARTPEAKSPPDHGRVVSEPEAEAERPSLEELREELNEQFESIKIVRPGEYELNLMELYNREEYIVSLQEDGRYVINVPDSWSGKNE